MPLAQLSAVNCFARGKLVMETEVGNECNGEAIAEDSVVGTLDSTERIAADPVVYQLVRVDGNGRLVPATDEEIMVVEDLLEDDKSKQFVMDLGETIECGVRESCASEEAQSNLLGESSNEEAVFKVNVQHEAALESNTLQEEYALPLPHGSCNRIISKPNPEGSSNPPGVLMVTQPVNPVTGSSWKPDFSKLKGEICLDNLTVRELQETFRATFGRETSVKDKQWLKRRIFMGLTNSCDFSATSFVIKDGKVVNKGTEISMGLVAGNGNKNSRASTDHCNDQSLDDLPGQHSPTKCPADYNHATEDHSMDQKINKRIRKPTKRYIEELSEVESRESCGKILSSNKHFGNRQPHEGENIRVLRTVQSTRPLVMRQESLGGSGIQVPYVSRIRRGRPRENIMALVRFELSGTGLANRQVTKPFEIRGPQLDKKEGNEILKSRLSPGQIQWPLLATAEKGNQHQNRRFMEVENAAELQNMGSDTSDDNAVKVTTPQGGMRRKHHRPWTLSEVVKLVEGVGKYGAGRWSEIKRVAFASSSYRTSVDLKDKWRNLLRASFAQLPTEEGMQNSRKHSSSVPIPVPILLRVRELAEMQSRVTTPMISACKLAEKSSGYL